MGDIETKVLDRIDEDKVAAACSGEGVAVLIPCYNEAITIGKVVDDFKVSLPLATIYVYDNNTSFWRFSRKGRGSAPAWRKYREPAWQVV